MRPPVGAFSSYSSPFSSSSSRSLSSSSHPCRAAAAPGALSEEQIAIVKGSAPALAEHGVEITTRFYERLFKLHPDLRSVFNSGHQATGTQQAALAAAVHAYAANIDNLGALGPAVTRIAHKHASLGVVPEQYPVVGENLLWAVKDVLGDAATPQLLDAWAVAYARLADIFIRAEADLYKEAAATPGGWNGWRKFRVDRKVRESDEIVSFYLPPQDGRALPKFKPGQYISVRVFVPELGLYQPREYSLSDAPNDKTFRISVKREFAADARPAGRVSNLLHEGLSEGSEIEVTHPYGDFTLGIFTAVFCFGQFCILPGTFRESGTLIN
ncbi:MAG: globin-like protein [Olpidium bornovanus]|uniref:nitric oxide dioxygenase n=1 Tax=Olpidium bornovanus TaxID=278681 RepID=A0A8H7ZZ16_9FUNG|nr:MAG: globin-like protein [Olpidium bornovanus]